MATAGRLAQKVAIVTGAGSGFGRAISLRFAQEGCRVLNGDINTDGAAETASRAAGGGSQTHISARFDVSKPDDWKAAVEQAVGRWGRIDVVVNNAGWSYKNKPTLDVSEDEFDRCFQLNVKSIFHSVRAVVPQFRAQFKEAAAAAASGAQAPVGGSIINVSSIGSERPRPGLVWYNSTKAAVSNASKALAAEYGAHQIRVNAICPLLSNTGLFEQFAGVPHTPENVEKLVAQVPLGRLTDPVDVANLALYLASDEGKFVTGQNLTVDGGKGI